jgi:CPA1 family monovalent cation:H+ antiporter
LFAASQHVDVGELKRRRRTILLLATASVILSTVIFGYGLWYLCLQTAAPLPLIWCVVLGAILAPTDAVVVEDLLRKAGLPPNLRAAIVGESLFNDGAGVVLFLLTIGITEGEVVHIGHGEVLGALTRAIAGGALLGIIAGWLAALLMRRIADDGLQLLISLALVLGCYRLAILADLSGPIAVVSAGLCLGSPSPPFGMTPDTRRVLMSFWSLLNALLNTMLFLFMGLQIIDLSVTATQWIAVLIAVPLALVARFVSVFVPFTLTRRFAGETLRATTVLTWAGLRGGISIALALTLPDTPWRTQLLLVTYAVVIFTIVAQGLSFERVLHAVYPNRVPA